MNIYNIDIKRSVVKEKLVPKSWGFEEIIDFIIFIPITIAVPMWSVLVLINQIERNDANLFHWLFFIFGLIATTFLVNSIANIDRLKRIKGKTAHENQIIIKTIARALDWDIIQNNKSITILAPPWSMGFDWGRRVFIIYDNQDILINSITFALFQAKSPFHWFADRRYENKLIKQFEEKTKE